MKTDVTRNTTTPIENILSKEDGSLEFYQTMYHRMTDILRSYEVVALHQNRFGSQHYFPFGKNDHWVENDCWIWDFPPIRIKVNNEEGPKFEVSPELTVDEALDNFGIYQNVLFIGGDSLLRPSEQFRLERAGRDVVKGHEYEVHKMSDEELRDFVIRFSDGHIWTSQHINQSLEMVFLPIAFGALSVPDELREEFTSKLMKNPSLSKWLKERRSEPELEDKPLKEDPPEAPPKPEDPTYVEYDPDVENEIVSKIEWGYNEDKDLQLYREEVDKQNAAIKDEHQKKLLQWKEQQDGWTQQCKQMEDDHKKKLQEWEDRNGLFVEDHKRWEVEDACWEAVGRGMVNQYLVNLGCVWADGGESKAANIGINGYPIFFECRMMHKEDFDRAMKAAQKETERRKSIEV